MGPFPSAAGWGFPMRWGNWVPHSTVLMLKPKVGEMVSTGSPLNLGSFNELESWKESTQKQNHESVEANSKR